MKRKNTIHAVGGDTTLASGDRSTFGGTVNIEGGVGSRHRGSVSSSGLVAGRKTSRDRFV